VVVGLAAIAAKEQGGEQFRSTQKQAVAADQLDVL